MYQEISKRQKLSALHIMVGLFISFSLLFIINTVAYLLDVHSSWVDLITFIIAAIIIYFVIREYFMSYRYMLIDNEFIIHQIIGSKEKNMLNIHVKQIQNIGPFCEENKEKNKKHFYKTKKRLCHTWLQTEKLYYVHYREAGEDHLFIFQPSRKMLELIEKKMVEISSEKNS